MLNLALFPEECPPLSSLDGIAVTTRGESLRINIQDITCLEGDGNYTYIHTRRQRCYLVSKTLLALTAQLDANFLRIHKSYIINTRWIAERLDEERIIRMSCGTEVPISRRKSKEIVSLLDECQNRVRP